MSFPLVFVFLLSAQVQAAFHLWDINEVFSNADGSLQFIELFSTSSGQEFLTNHSMTATSSTGSTTVFTFPSNSSAPTSNKHLLLATRDFQAVTGIEPDFIIPTGFLPTAGGSLDFANVDEISLIDLPINGTQSFSGIGAIETASPTNFAGNTNSTPSTDIVFDGATGTLEIAFISVEGLGNYSASLELLPGDPLRFDLISATLLSDLLADDLATVSLNTGVMTLPRVIVGENIYSAALMLDTTTEALRFTLISAELLE